MRRVLPAVNAPHLPVAPGPLRGWASASSNVHVKCYVIEKCLMFNYLLVVSVRSGSAEAGAGGAPQAAATAAAEAQAAPVSPVF